MKIDELILAAFASFCFFNQTTGYSVNTEKSLAPFASELAQALRSPVNWMRKRTYSMLAKVFEVMALNDLLLASIIT